MSRQRSGQEASQSRIVCQVCQVDLTNHKQAKAYCLKKKVCPTHLQADVVYLPGRDAPYRFCHQCGKFEPLDCFDGTRRSCRERTFQRRVKYHNQLHPPAAAAQSTTSPSKPRRAPTADAPVAHPQDAPAKQQQLPRTVPSVVAGAQQAQPSATQLLSHLAALVGQNEANSADSARAQASSARAGAAGHGQVPLPQAGRSNWAGAVLGQEQPFLRQPQLHRQRAQHPEQFAQPQLVQPQQQLLQPQQQFVQPQQQLLQPQQQLVQPQLQQPVRQLQQALPIEPQHLQQDVSGLSRGGDDAQQYVTVGGIRMTGREAQEVVYTLLQRELEKCRQQDDLQLPHFSQQPQQGQKQGQGSVPLLQPPPTQQQQQQGPQAGELELLLSGRNASHCSPMQAPVSPASGLALGLGGVGVHSPLAASLAMQGAQAVDRPAPPAPPALPARAVAEATESLLQTVQRLQALLSDPNLGLVDAELITAAATAAAAALAAVEGTGTGVQQAQQHVAQQDWQLGHGRQDQGLLLQQAQQLLVQEQQQLEEESRRLRAAAYVDPSAAAAAAGLGAGTGPNLSLVGPSVPQAMGAHGVHGSAHSAHALRQHQQGQSSPGVSDLIHSLLAALAGQQPGPPLGEGADARAAAAAAETAGLQLAGHGHRTSNQSNPYRGHYQHTAPPQQGAATLPRSLSAVVALLTGDAAGQQGILGPDQALSPLASPTVQQQPAQQQHQVQEGLSSLSEQLAAAVRASLAESSSGQGAMQAPAQTHQQQQGPNSYAQSVAGAVPGHDRGDDLAGVMLGSLLASTCTQPGSHHDQAYQGVDPALAERLANALRGSICADASAGTPVAGAVAAAAASPTAAGGMDMDVYPAGCSTSAAAPAAHALHDAAIPAGRMPVAAQAQAGDAGVVPASSEGQAGQHAPPNAAAAQVLAEIYSVLASMSGPQG